MDRARDLFDGQPDWLAHTLALGAADCSVLTVTLSQGDQVHRLGTGLLEIRPAALVQKGPALILSAGIHGNETAPVELLNRFVGELLQGAWCPSVPVLLVLGNPPAMVVEERFLEHNLNRLFTGAHRQAAAGYEARRAARLEGACLSFHKAFPGPVQHYDLHTAIRPSKRERFALYPFVEGRRVPETELAFLGEAGIGTLVLQHRPATTFSSFTAAALGAESFTLELGRVRPFGQNDLSGLDALGTALERLASGQPSPRIPETDWPERFEVIHEILNTGEGFRFHIADDVANFTLYPPGTLIWEDDTTRYRVGAEPEAIVFPNPRVPVGHRVGLMIRSCTCDH
ncbi:succinylglutamate desuccinylase [Marinobacter daqiaonensis]|uniref:Succinylglutamate desuccinylase n=1 Tax=Marinobacter daqiaonensis TaxID=650891 RepID=A0A1I6HU46_9GAMM|nr:succinylglutamate desuccinylase [Marinobacter daqiaonensis]SFR57927.1 succinylglutamate desuccinylase [Marinobacter daqiaonensis]